MPDNPKITVFMPMFNAEKFIGEAVDSILNQTFKDFELLIIDDGSNDQSREIVEKYQDSRIRLYVNERNRGLPYTRNRGLELARGKYLAVMDADDISDPYRLAKQWNYMENHPETVVLASGKDLLTEEDNIHDSYGIKEKLYSFLFYRTSQQIGINLIFENIISNSTTMIRLSFLMQHKIYYNSQCFVMQDYELWTQIFANGGQFHILREALVKYRSNQNNITTRTRENVKEKRRMLQRMIQKNYLQMLGYQLDEKWLKLIEECGKEYEEKQNIDTNFYLQQLYMFFEKLIGEYPAECVIQKCQMINFLRKKYFLFSLKSGEKGKNLKRTLQIR